MKTPLRAKLFPFALLMALGACQSKPTAQAAPTQAAQAKTAAELLQGVLAEHKALEAMFISSPEAARQLGALNGQMQQRGYFRRVPAQPALDSAESSLRRLAAAKALTVQSLELRPPAETTAPAPAKLAAGQRWNPSLDELRGVVALRIDLQGSLRDAAGFVDALPSEVDRLIVITSREALPGGVSLRGELYFEKPLPPPELVLQWPTLQERLKTAGWSDTDGPALQAKLKADPQLAEFAKQVDLGHQRLPDVRRTLQITADFPRWLLRWKFFEDRAKAATAVQGVRLLGL